MATIQFTGLGQTGNWADGLNWKGGKAPGAADIALVVGGPDTTVASAMTVNDLMVIGGQTETFTGTITSYGVGDCRGLMVCVNATVRFDPGSSLTDGGVLQAGVGGVGTFVATGTAAQATTIQSKNGTIGKLVGSVGTVTIDGAHWTTTGGIEDGRAGAGSLNVTDGGMVAVGGNFVMGVDAGSTGQATLSGASSMTVHGDTAVGRDAPTASTATLTIGAGSSFAGQGSVRVASGSAIDLTGGALSVGTGNLHVLAGGAIAGSGAVTTHAGSWIGDDGSIEAKGGTLTLGGAVNGTGTIQIDAGSTAAITGASVNNASISFGAGATLSLAKGATVKAVLNGFAAGDKITMAGIDNAAWSSVTDELTLSGAGKTVDHLHLGGSYASDTFTVTQSGGVGMITVHNP